MEISIIKQGTGASELMVNGEKKLAVTTGLVSKIYKQISRQDLLSEPGILIRGSKTEYWNCTESLELEGKLIFPGPFIKGKTLADSNPDIEILLNMAILFKKITEDNIPLTGVYTPGIFITDEGSILLFPPKLINYITSQLSEDKSIILWQPYNHPNISGKEQFPFAIAVLSYKLLTGELPYTGNSLQELREKMRISKSVDIKLMAPGIYENIADIINKSLSLKEADPDRWIEVLTGWKERGAIKQIDKAEFQNIKKAAEKKQEQLEKKFSRYQFFSRNWKTIGIILSIFLILTLFSLGPIKNAMKPPATLNMDANEVVNFYYQSYSDMNIENMEDCLKKGVGKKDINEITQLYVISKVRKGYEGKSGLVSAQDWSNGLITKLSEGEQIAGIANLHIKYLGDSLFQANYERWFSEPLTENDSTGILKPKKVIYTDTLTLDKIKDVWTIVKLERNTKE